MAEIILFGVIGDAVDKLDAATVCAQIRSAKGPLSVRINSGGGYVMEGLAIYEALASYDRGPVTVYIDGLAASMASVIAMAGQEIIMAESALMMIHRPWDAAIGHADDMRKKGATLDKVEGQLVGIYAKRTGLSPAELTVMLAEETWFTADEAVERGFATATTAPLKLVAMVDVSACGFRNLPDVLKDSTMTDKTKPAALADIITAVAKADLPAAYALDLAKEELPIEAVRARIVDKLAEDDERLAIRSWQPSEQTFDNPGFQAQAISDALYARLSGKEPTKPAAELMNLTMVDMARLMVQKRGGARNLMLMRPESVLDAAAWNGGRSRGWIHETGGRFASSRSAITHTTSDFPELLSDAGHRYLMDVFQAAESPIKGFAKRLSVPDFRDITHLRLGTDGSLDVTNEAGEIKSGTFVEDKEAAYSIDTYTKKFSISRQLIVNDRLGAFADALSMWGRMAAEKEATLLAAKIDGNGPTMGDGVVLYHTSHGNKAGTGGAIDVTTLSAARQAMRDQKALDGTTPINARAKYLLTSSAKETEAEQVLATLAAAQITDVNPFSGKLELKVEPRLTGNSWRLFAEPSQHAVVEVAYLEGREAPQLDSREGWDVLGMEFRVVHDFGAGVIGWRGTYLNPGN